MEEEAIILGLDLHYFWTLTPKQWAKYIKVFNDKEKARLKEIDTLNYVLGKYIAFGVNDPKHYPDKPYSYKENEMKNMTDEEMEKQARRNTIIMGGVINDS